MPLSPGPASAELRPSGGSSVAALAALEGLFFERRFDRETRPADDDATLAAYRKALAVDPRHVEAIVGKGGPPPLEIRLWARSFAFARLGRVAEAHGALRASQGTAARRRTSEVMWSCFRLQLAAAQGGDAESRTFAKRVVETVEDERADALTISNAALFATTALVPLNLEEEALRLLSRSVEIGLPPPSDWLLREPALAELRSHPRFASLLAASREGAAMVADLLVSARHRGERPQYLDAPLSRPFRRRAGSRALSDAAVAGDRVRS